MNNLKVKLGKALMDYLIKYCKLRKAKGITLDAQYYLKDYYKKFGFVKNHRLKPVA